MTQPPKPTDVIYPARPSIAPALFAFGFAALIVGLALVLLAHPSRPAARRLYLSSLAYLALLFVAMALDRAL